MQQISAKSQNLLLLVIFVLLICCDNTETNKRLIQGEWVVDSLSEYPVTIAPNGKLDRGSRVLVDDHGKVGIFLTDTTKRPQVYYYYISDDRLTILIIDYGIPYEIERLSNEVLIIKRLFAGVPDDKSPRIRMIKAQ